MPREYLKIAYEKGRELVKDGFMTEDKFQKAMLSGKIAGIREKDSFRLKGVREKITVSFPTPKVTLPKGMSLKVLNTEDRLIVEDWKQILSESIRPVFNKLRERYTEKVAVKY